jgi:hypothetical protein
LFTFPLSDNSWPASALKCAPPSPPLLIPVPSHSIPSRTHHHTDVSPSLMCSGLMVVGHCLDCYSLLSVVFTVFHGHPGHGSSHRTSSHSHAHLPRCTCLQLGLLVTPCLPGITLCRQFAISFSHRSECFFIVLRCFRVSSPRLPGFLHGGSRSMYQKALRTKSKKIYSH